MGKWTDAGFVANTLDYYKTEIQKVFVGAFGDDFLLDDSLPQGILITRLAELFYNADMDGVEAFSRLNINTASGVFLDIIGGLRGIPRSTGTPQIATVQLTIDPARFQPFYIAQGTEFRTTNSGEVFVAREGQAVNSADASIQLYYSSNGNSVASVNDTMTTTGYDQITNIVITYLVDGVGTETDLEYRARLGKTLPLAGNTIESVQALLLANEYVRLVGVNYNDTDATVDTLPPYSTEWMAVPKSGYGEDQAFMDTFKEQVGTIIINNKTPGAPTAGNTTVTVTDAFGTSKEVKFTIPTEVEIEIYVQVSTPEATGTLDLGSVPEEREAIKTYIDSLDIGKDVSYARCIAPLAADTGFDISVFRMRRRGGEWVTGGNVSIGKREYASVDISDITIEV